MNPERWDYWDYWNDPDIRPEDEFPDRPPIPWHEALDGATHALWSDNIGWYFWRVHAKGVTEHDINGTGRWRAHQDQIGIHGSQAKLKRMLAAGNAFRRPTHDEQPDEEGYTPMNLNNAALLVRDDITTVEVRFPDNRPDNTFTYILHNSVNVAVDDMVLVQRKGAMEVGQIAKIDEEPQINVNSNTHYKWVIANVTDLQLAIESEIEKSHCIARALKQRQASNVRDQILAQFGVTNAQELMALGQDNQQSE